MTTQIETVDDERAGLPSMSGAERMLNCPGSVALSRGLSTAEKAWTRDGALGHEVLAGEAEEEELDGREDVQWAVERCKTISNALALELGFEAPDRVVTEERLWLHDDQGEPVASGKVDRALICGTRALVLDWKLGRKAVTAAPANPQAIGYAVLLAEEHGVREAFLAIVQPWRKPQPAGYIDALGLATWRRTLLDGLSAARQPDAPRLAGPWCDYCPARAAALCPEARAVVKNALAVFGLHPPELLSMPARYALMSPEQRLEFHDWKAHAKRTLKELDEIEKEWLTANPDATPGLRVKPGSELVKLPGSLEVYDVLKQRLSLGQMLSCATFSLPNLASVSVGGKPGVKKLGKPGEEAKAELKLALGDYTKVTIKSGTVERV